MYTDGDVDIYGCTKNPWPYRPSVVAVQLSVEAG